MRFQRLTVLLIFLAVAAVARAQVPTSFQTLPAGFDAVPGNASSIVPVNTFTPGVTAQWHYDSAEFTEQAPIIIQDIAIRPSSPVAVVNAYDFQYFEITLIEAKTDYPAGAHNPEFALNILRSTTVRTGPLTGGPHLPTMAPTGVWVSLQLQEHFVFDPSQGNDLIVQIRSCNPISVWGTNLDVQTGPTGTVGGARYANSGVCDAAFHNGAPAVDFVPIIRLAYIPATQTLPRGFDVVDGGAPQSMPFGTPSDLKCQFHYGSEQFEAQAPIVINEIWVRPADEAAGWGPYNYNDIRVTLGAATTDYEFGNHAPVFGENLDRRQEEVRSGPFIGPGVGPDPGGPGKWIPLGLTKPFVYDPSSGRDFIVQIERCASPHGERTIDAAFGPTGTVGGNRYSHTSSCTALAESLSANADFVPVLRIDFEPLSGGAGVIDRFPYREDFDEVGLGFALPQGWTNVEGEAVDGMVGDWISWSGSTPSAGTGPTADITGGNYLYVEDSGSDNFRVELLSPCFDLTGLAAPRLSLRVHSRQAITSAPNKLTISVEPIPAGPPSTLMYLAQGVGPSWVPHSFDLSAWAGQKVRFRFSVNTNNGDFGHDIAIDKVHVYDQTVQTGQAPRVEATLDANHATDAEGHYVETQRPGPYFADVHFGEHPDIVVRGNPFQPFCLFQGPLAVGFASIPGIGQIDIGAPGTILIDGVNGTGTVPGIFHLNAMGAYRFAGPSMLHAGVHLSLQAAVFTGGPDVVKLSNALVVVSR